MADLHFQPTHFLSHVLTEIFLPCTSNLAREREHLLSKKNITYEGNTYMYWRDIVFLLGPRREGLREGLNLLAGP